MSDTPAKSAQLARHSLPTTAATALANLRRATSRVDRRWLLTAGRATWGILALLSLLLFAAGVVTEFGQLRRLCPTDACNMALSTVAGRQELQRLGIAPGQLASYVRATRSLRLTFPSFITYTIVLQIALALVYALVASLIFWRKSHEHVAWFASLALLTFGLATYADVLPAVQADNPSLWLPIAFLRCLGSAAFVVFLLLFPSGRFVPTWTKWVALAWVAVQIPEYFFPNSALALARWPLVLSLVIWSALFATVIFAQVYSYRHVASLEQRRQTKWVVHGIAVALVVYFTFSAGVPLALGLGPLTDPSPSTVAAILMVLTLTTLALLLIPVSIAIAILRHHLFDIDLIISQTLVYAALVGILALIYQGTLVTLQLLFATVTGQDSFLANVVSTVIIGALFEPLRRRISAFFQRHLNAKLGLVTQPAASA